MGEEMLHALGYAYVRQTQKLRGKQAAGAARIGGFYEGVLQSAHTLSEGASAVGSAVSMAGDLAKLSRDAKPETPPEKRLSEAQRAELTERVQKRTLAIVWAITKRQIETTARSVVDELLGANAQQRDEPSGRMISIVCPPGVGPGGLVRVEVEGQGVGVRTLGIVVPEGVEEGQTFDVAAPDDRAPPISAEEAKARADALMIIGGIFSGEKQSEAVDKAIKAINDLNQLGGVAADKASKLASLAGDKASKASSLARSWFGWAETPPPARPPPSYGSCDGGPSAPPPSAPTPPLPSEQ